MSEKKQQLMPPSAPRLPAVRTPQPSFPSMPSSSGKWLGSPSTIMEADRRYVEIHAGFLRARADQADAMTQLVGSREKLALAIARLHDLPEVCHHEHIKGKMDRLSELRLLELKHETDEINARTVLEQAKMLLAAYGPPTPEPLAQPQAPTGLTPADVQKAAQMVPEIKPETIEALVLMLGGLLAEKNR